MTILYREVTQNSVLWGALMIVVVLLMSVYIVYGIISLLESMANARRLNPRRYGVKKFLMGVLFFALISNMVALYNLIGSLGVKTERVEALQMMDDFEEQVVDRGYEVVERRGEIVVLEREIWE